ncbi:MAG: SAF domain-containing protein [Acidimicrobiia bacterium]
MTDRTAVAPAPEEAGRPAQPVRQVARPAGVPGGRAIVGGLLVALAGVATFVAWQRSTGTPGTSYAVAARAIGPGERLTVDDVRLEPIDLPDGVAAAAFTGAAEIVDRVTLGPVGEGELLQRGQLSDPAEGAPSVEVSFAIDPDRAVDGRLSAGDLVDVFVTMDGRTEAVAEGVRVAAVAGGDGRSFGGDRRITVTLALADPARRAPLIHAVRQGEVTLVRSTHLAGPGAPGAAGAGGSTWGSPAGGGATGGGPAGGDATGGGPAGGSPTPGTGGGQTTGGSAPTADGAAPGAGDAIADLGPGGG